MKKIGTLVMASLLVSSVAWADSNAEGVKAASASATETKNVATSLVAAEKRSETTVISVGAAVTPALAPRVDDEAKTLLIGKFPTVASTKAEAKTQAGQQKEVGAPSVALAVKASEAAPPAVLRAVSGLSPKLKTCLAKPKGPVVVNVSVSDAGQLSATVASGALEADEASCVTHAIATAKVRGARGTVSVMQLPL